MVETSVIILNYNQKAITVTCVKSVLSQTYKNFEIILVDNASTDGSLEAFEKEFGKRKKIKIIANKENTGYTGGNNLGASHAKGKYVVVLNNDTFCEKEWLKELVDVPKKNPNAAMASSNVVNVPNGDPERMKEVENHFYERMKGTYNVLGYDILLGEKTNEAFYEICAAHGGGFIYKKDIVGNAPFDQEYFIYAEETKLGWTTRIRGYKILWAKNARVYHLHNTVRRSDPRIEKKFRFLGERNKITNWLTFYELGTTLKLIPIYFLAILMINLFEPNKILQRVKAYLWILSHPNWWLSRRKEIQSVRKMCDADLFILMSAKLNDESRMRNKLQKEFLKIINKICCSYCRFAGLRFVEHNI